MINFRKYNKLNQKTCFNDTINTITINNLIWSSENLKVTKFNDGTNIPIVEDINKWANLKTPAMCYLDNDKNKGTLYNWHVINTGKLAPKGWHISTDKEWDTITDKNQITSIIDGYRNFNGTFTNIGGGGYLWSATAYNAINAWYRYIGCAAWTKMGRNTANYSYGFGVRCIKD